MPMPMYHRGCGGLVLWRLGQSQRRGGMVIAAEILFASDGESPNPTSPGAAPCTRCSTVVSIGDLTNLRTPYEIDGRWP